MTSPSTDREQRLARIANIKDAVANGFVGAWMASWLLAELERVEAEHADANIAANAEEEAALKWRSKYEAAEARAKNAEDTLTWIASLAAQHESHHTAFRHIGRRIDAALSAATSENTE